MSVPEYTFRKAQAVRSTGISHWKGLLVFLVAMCIIFIVLVVYVTGDFGTGYKFTVTGKVTYSPDFLYQGPGTWEITNLQYTTPERDWSVLSTLWSWPWASDGVVVKGGGDELFSPMSDLGQFNVALGETKTFSLEFRHVEPGNHVILIEAVENMCGIIPINCDSVTRCSNSISINIEGEIE